MPLSACFIPFGIYTEAYSAKFEALSVHSEGQDLILRCVRLSKYCNGPVPAALFWPDSSKKFVKGTLTSLNMQ